MGLCSGMFAPLHHRGRLMVLLRAWTDHACRCTLTGEQILSLHHLRVSGHLVAQHQPKQGNPVWQPRFCCMLCAMTTSHSLSFNQHLFVSTVLCINLIQEHWIRCVIHKIKHNNPHTHKELNNTDLNLQISWEGFCLYYKQNNFHDVHLNAFICMFRSVLFCQY